MVQRSNIFLPTIGGVASLGTYAVYQGGNGGTDYGATRSMRWDDNDIIGLMFRVQDANDYYRFSWDLERGNRRLVRNRGGVFTTLAEDSVPYVKGQSYLLDVRAQGDQLEVYVDGALVFSVTDDSIGQGSIAAYSAGNQGSAFDDIQVIDLAAADPANQAPVVTDPSAQTGIEGEVVSLGILASDPDGDALTYSATGLPTGLSIDSQSGLVSGTLGGAGTYGVTISVSDGIAQAGTSFSWVVSAANRAPVVTNPGAQSGTEGEVVSVGILASDPDGDALAYSATGLPTGLSIDSQSGLISGTLGGAGTYGVTVTVSDGSAQANANFDWVVDLPSTIRAEAGVVTDVTNADWALVTLEHTYDSMVVVATPRYGPSAPPQIVRVRNADANSFELAIARVDGGSETVSSTVDYLVVEEGVYDAATYGVTMEAVKYRSAVTDSKSSWVGEWQTYANSYQNPVVIGQVMSADDPLPSSFWARGDSRASPPNASTLYTGKTVCEDPDRIRTDELIGYLVIEAGSGILGNRYFEAGVGLDTVRGMGNAAPYAYPLDNLASAEVALLSMAAMDGSDGGWPVLVEDLDPSGTAIGIAVDEDQLKDSERGHTTEQIAYLVLEYAAVDGN